MGEAKQCIRSILYQNVSKGQGSESGERDVFGYGDQSHSIAQRPKRSIEIGDRAVDSDQLQQRGRFVIQCVFEGGDQKGDGIGCFEGGTVVAEIQNRSVAQSGKAEEEGGFEEEDVLQKEERIEKEEVLQKEDGVKEEDGVQKEELFEEESELKEEGRDEAEDGHKEEELLKKEGVIEEEDGVKEKECIEKEDCIKKEGRIKEEEHEIE